MRATQGSRMIAVCGLDCKECRIFKAQKDPEIAREVVEWFKKEMDIDVKAEDIRCSGCKGDRSRHWSPDCWILRCCFDEKGLEFCYQCEDFPCSRLEEWAEGSERYVEALNRLKEMGEMERRLRAASRITSSF